MPSPAPSLFRQIPRWRSFEFATAVTVGVVLPTIAVTFGVRDAGLLLLAAGLAGVSCLRPGISIITVVATFVFSALARRLLPAADPAVDLAAIVPFIVAVPLGLHGLRQPKPTSGVLLLLWVTLTAVLSFGAPLVGLAGWLNFVVPLLAAYAIHAIPDGLRTLARATVACGAVASTYGIAQYFIAFPWDTAWLNDAAFVTAGQFGEENFRPFATLPSPLTAAMLCAVVILLVVFRSDLLGRSPALPAYGLVTSTILLLLTQVRSVWVALGVAFLVALLLDQGRSLRRLAGPLVVVVLVVMISPVGATISARAQTLGDLESDVSYQERFGLLGVSGDLLSPIGRGLGELSAGSRVEADSSIDNGYLVILGEMGLIGLGLFTWAFVSRTRGAQRHDLPFVVVLLIANSSALIIANLPGLLLWTLMVTDRPLEPEGTDQAS